MNVSAHELIRAADGVSLRAGELTIADLRAAALVRRGIRSITATVAEPPAPFTIRRSSGATYVAIVAPVRSPEPLAVGMLIITDPTRDAPSLHCHASRVPAHPCGG